MPTSLRVVQFKDPLEFVEATQEYDDNSMNFVLGSIMDYSDEAQAQSQARWGAPTRILLVVYRQDELLLSLTKHAKDFSWLMASPSHVEPESHRDAADIAAAAQLLAEFLSTVADPSSLDKVLGPEQAVNAFIEAWVEHTESRGIRLKKPDPYFRSVACYATRLTLPPPSTASHEVFLASGPDVVASLVPLFIDFSSRGPNPVTPEAAHIIMREAVEAQKIWICRSQKTVAGYLRVGRVTPRTIAIRNVFVHPDHRRKGIAEALVCTVTRYYLGADPFETESTPMRAAVESRKQEVCLNVGDPAAMRLYSRCGFMLHEDARDPETGRKGWFRTLWRGVEPL